MLNFDELIDLAEQRGWRIKECANNHRQLLSPDGKHIVVTGSTPSDHRALLNFTTDLRRAGLVIEETKKKRFRPGELKPEILKIVGSGDARIWSVPQLVEALNKTFPGTETHSVYNCASDMVKERLLKRVSVGHYVLPDIVAVKPAAILPKAWPPPTIQTTAIVNGKSADMTELDQCVDQILDGVGKLQAVVGRVHGIMSQLDALRAALNTGAKQ